MRRAITFLLILFLAAPLFGQKHRVAVMDFNYGTVQSSVAAIFGSDQDVGKGIVDLLIDRLVNDGTYRVIERQALDKIMAEQNFSNSNRADPNSAAKIGKLLGVDTIIVGDITQFGRDDHNTNVGGMGSTLGKYGLGGVGLHKSKAVVAVTARMVDVNTGEILASVSGTGESARSGTNLLGGGGSGWSSGAGHLDMGSSNFGQTILGEAVKQAVTQLAGGLEADAPKLGVAAAPAAVPVSGLVADASSSDIIINVGSSAGVHVGDKLDVTRVTRVIKDPATGKPLRSIETKLGQLTITSVDSGSAVGTFSGSGTIKVGDTVKTP
ncbi:CsgG/HfaB family protein [Edaphobacter sp.]|uniref:CsgG/HfaB family protein n=1 Tax=Edaphobacter sp. TaxID=1934404 RepID=UPI002DB6A69D|nr:CsgG/HfaB family protein [Edaphobacter sp.]HEU5340119.1 CsgG/HfaB family protein [Edaphobacter sp.]